MGRFIFNFNVWDRSRAKQALLKTEHLSKHAVVGCESCGQCRLGETLYICPETCPKGLANGPCGGPVWIAVNLVIVNVFTQSKRA